MKVRNLKRVMRRPNTDEKLDSNEAARLLHVSRSYFDALVRSGELAATRCAPNGPHQRFSKAGLLAYKKRLKIRQRRGLKMMVKATQRMGLYDAELDRLQTVAPSD